MVAALLSGGASGDEELHTSLFGFGARRRQIGRLVVHVRVAACCAREGFGERLLVECAIPAEVTWCLVHQPLKETCCPASLALAAPGI